MSLLQGLFLYFFIGVVYAVWFFSHKDDGSWTRLKEGINELKLCPTHMHFAWVVLLIVGGIFATGVIMLWPILLLFRLVFITLRWISHPALPHEEDDP